jgi:hypothetical protein
MQAQVQVPSLETLLSFERSCAQLQTPAKHRRIRAELGLSPLRYAALLNRYIDQPEALALDPMLVMSLRRLRDQRRALRSARPVGAAYQTSLFSAPSGPEPLEVAEPLETLADGEQLREVGMASADAAAAEAWKLRVEDAIAECARRTGLDGPLPFTAEDVRPLAGDPPEGTSPNAMGARFMAAARRGQIRKVGYRNGARPSLHAHPIAIWVGAQEAS